MKTILRFPATIATILHIIIDNHLTIMDTTNKHSLKLTKSPTLFFHIA